MWSGLPFKMMTEFKGKCSKKKRGAEEDLISFFDLDSEVRRHHVCVSHALLVEAVTMVWPGSRRRNVDPASLWKSVNIT